MASTIIYRVSTNPENCCDMDEDTFYDLLETPFHTHLFDHAETEGEADAEISLDAFLRDLRRAFSAKPVPGTKRFTFTTPHEAGTEDAKRRYFAEREQKLRTYIETLPEGFLADDAALETISQILTDTEGDMVYLDMGNYPTLYLMNDFIRKLCPDTTYYIGDKTIRIHY